MKVKLSSMWRVAIALVLVVGLSLVMAVPVSANVGTVTVTVAPNTISTVAKYTIVFNTEADGGLTAGVDTITVTFPSDTTVPASYTTGDITVNGTAVAGTAVSVVVRAVTITTPVSISASTAVTVIFTTAADIVNPSTAGDKTLTVKTSAWTVPATSANYTIIGKAEVTSVSPNSGNEGDTMWVEVAGTNFTGTDTTNASDTTLVFGTGVTVVATKFIDDTEIDAQINITASGAVRTVTANTTAGTGTVGVAFTPNPADTKQVDVWLQYTPTDLIFDGDTLKAKADPMTYTTTIKAAVDDLTPDDTAIVHAATYTETAVATIGVANVKLLSLNGAATTIIIAPAAANVIDITAAGVTVDGFTLQDTASGKTAINVTGDNATVENNIMTATTGYPEGIRIAASGATVSGNDLDIHHTMMVISGSTIELSDNTFGAGINLQTSGVDIIDNEIIGSEFTGIVFESTANFSDILIDGNTISGTTQTDEGTEGIGIAFRPEVTGTISDLTIQRNNITDNEGAGIVIPSTVTTLSNVVINYNSISGNADYGIENAASGAVDAKYNWWGDVSGPTGASGSTALGSGDKITDAATDFEPWLTETYAETSVDNIRYYAALMPLEKGWNTLSVPLALKSTAKTLTQIVALGDYINDTGALQNYAGGYYYDVTWKSLTGDYEFAPGKAVYVKMLADANFPVVYSGQIGLPTLSLGAGWNLIGSTFGIDKTSGGDFDYGIAAYDDTDGYKTVVTALDSIKANASVVVSPAVPGQTAAWGTTVADDTTKMIVGEGYWVYMEAADILVGFEVTPMYFTILD